MHRTAKTLAMPLLVLALGVGSAGAAEIAARVAAAADAAWALPDLAVPAEPPFTPADTAEESADGGRTEGIEEETEPSDHRPGTLHRARSARGSAAAAAGSGARPTPSAAPKEAATLS